MIDNKEFKFRLALAATLVLITLLVPEIVSAVSLTKTQDLDFGKFVPTTLSGTVTISPSGSRYASGGVKLSGTGFSPAKFTIHGLPLAPYVLTLPASLTIASGIDHLEITSVSASVPLIGQLPASGLLSFAVGGTLVVSGAKGAATYSGNLDLSAN